MYRNTLISFFIALLCLANTALAQHNPTFSHYQPTIANTTSVTCLAANKQRKGFTIQNTSETADVMINLAAATLTGAVPSDTNKGFVLLPGGSYTTPPQASPTSAVTCYQDSGVSVNFVSIVEY